MSIRTRSSLIVSNLLFISLCVSCNSVASTKNYMPSPTATETHIPTATITPTPTYTATSPPTQVLEPDFPNSKLFIKFINSGAEGGDVTSCDLISPYFNTEQIVISADIYMPDGTTPAGDLPVTMVLTNEQGHVQYNVDNQFIVLASGDLLIQPEGVAGGRTHTAIFPGVKLIDANGDYAPMFYQLRMLNPDGTIDGQIGGLEANCKITKAFKPVQPVKPSDSGGDGTGSDGGPPPNPHGDPTPIG